LPIGSGAVGVARAHVAVQAHVPRRLHLHEVEQAVEVEVDDGRARAPGTKSRSPPLRPLLDERAVGGR
jgi:hypothetical protein